MASPRNIDLFCQVIDNFGDIGVSWRLARQLVAEHGAKVTLYVDDLNSFGRLCRDADAGAQSQKLAGVQVARWPVQASVWTGTMPDLVIEAFGCRLPDAYVHSMAACERPPVWINLEYLSAEAWVEGCHGLASPHPSLPLTKYFFFPGMTARTGGLLAEHDLALQRDTFQANGNERLAFAERLTGERPDPDALLVSLFCYPNAPVVPLLQAWQAGAQKIVCLVPEGIAGDALERFAGMPAAAGARASCGALRLHGIPFLDQPDYDRLLWTCDVNFVRGEDSFVRAQWAQRPLVWQIYPQEDDAHLVKLDAFLGRYTAMRGDMDARRIQRAFHAWNGGEHGASGEPDWWEAFAASLPALNRHARQWANSLSRNGDLASKLIEFASKFG